MADYFYPNYLLTSGGTISGNLIVTGDLTVQGNLNFGDVGTDILTVAGYLQGSAAGTTYLRVGSGTTSHAMAATNDLLVSGKLEVNGATYLDSTLDVAGASTFGAALTPLTNDVAALGSITLGFSDLFLASGGVINWANGDSTITNDGSGTITVSGADASGVVLATASDKHLLIGGGGQVQFRDTTAFIRENTGLQLTAGATNPVHISSTLRVNATGTATVGNPTYNSYKLMNRASVWDTDGSADTWDYYWQVEPTSAATTTAVYKLYASKNEAAGTSLASFTTTVGNPVFTGNVTCTGGSFGTSQGSGSATLYGTYDDGAAAIGVILKNTDTLSNATSLIAQFTNNATAQLNVGFGGMLTWPNSGQAIAAASYQIGRDADATNQLHFNVPTGSQFEFSINDTATMVVNNSALIHYGSAAGYVNIQTGASGVGVQFRSLITSSTSAANFNFINDSGASSFNASSGTQLFHSSSFTVNQSGTAGYTADKIVVTETATGSGTKLLADWGTAGGGTLFSVTNAGLAYAAGGIRTKVSVANVSNPPTDAELDSAFGTPATVGSGFHAIVDDNDGGTLVYLVYTTGTNDEWFYLTGTKAV